MNGNNSDDLFQDESDISSYNSKESFLKGSDNEQKSETQSQQDVDIVPMISLKGKKTGRNAILKHESLSPNLNASPEPRLRKQSNYKKSQLTSLMKFQKRRSKYLEAEKLLKKYGPNTVFLYREGQPLPDLALYLNSIIEIRIAKQYIQPLTKQMMKRNIWGCETYTSDSDAVCIIKHSNLYNTDQPFPKNYEGIAFYCKVAKARKSYNSVSKNGIKSRSIKGYSGHSLKPEKIMFLNSIGSVEELMELAKKMPTKWKSNRLKNEASNDSLQMNISKYCENNIVFNMCDEFAHAYCLANICDKSSDVQTWTSFQLREKTLYLETSSERFEISIIEQQSQPGDDEVFFDNFDLYKFSKIKDPRLKDNLFMDQVNIPLDDEFKEIVFESLDWSEIQWGASSILIKESVRINIILNYKFYPNKQFKANSKQHVETTQ